MIERFVFGLAVPLAVGAVLALVLRRSRYGSALGLTAGFATACALFEWMPWVPNREWEWLPYLGIFVGLFGAVTIADGVWHVERAALGVAVALLAAWVVLPEWESLRDSRWAYFFGIAGGLVLLGVLMDPLPDRFEGNGFLWAMAASAGAGSYVLFASASASFAQLAGALFAACVGCAITDRQSARGALPAFVVLLGSLMVTGRLNSFSDLPWGCYVLPPAAPVLFWLRRGRIGALLVAVPLTSAVVMAVIYEPFNPLDYLQE